MACKLLNTFLLGEWPMKYTTVYVQQLKDRKGKPWQARAKYKDPLGKWKEISKMLPEAKGIREAKRMARGSDIGTIDTAA